LRYLACKNKKKAVLGFGGKKGNRRFYDSRETMKKKELREEYMIFCIFAKNRTVQTGAVFFT
jgi:hypothetical protein